MRRVSKIAAAGVVSAALALTATACGSSSTSDSGKDKGVGMAYDVGGRGDHSFNDSAARGLDKATKEFKLGSKELTASQDETESDREQRLDSLAAAGYNPVVAVGFTYGDAVTKIAQEVPEDHLRPSSTPSVDRAERRQHGLRHRAELVPRRCGRRAEDQDQARSASSAVCTTR